MKRFTLIVFIVSAYSFLFLFVLSHQIVFAATADSVNQQITDVNAQIQALDKEIAQYQDQINQTSAQSNTLANLIKELTLTRDSLLKQTQQTEKKITATGLVIGTLNSSITAQQASINNSKEVIRKIFRSLSQSDSTTLVEKVLSKQNIVEVSREYNDLLSIKEKVNDAVVALLQKQKILSESKKQKEIEQQNLTNLKQALTDKKLAVDITKKEKSDLLTETKNKESNYQKLLADRQKKRDLFEKDLGDYEAQLKFILNPTLLPNQGSGILSWPLDNIFITQLFGKTVAAKQLYVTGSHSGVDFRASIGTQVKSMATGTVIGTGNTDDYCKGASFGKWVFIKYDNGLSSTFGHLSVISSTAGQKVNTGDVVGLSGNTGHSTGPHLHVTVYASQGADVKTVPSISCNGKIFTMPIAPTSAYLDPLLYLPQVPAGKFKNDTKRD